MSGNILNKLIDFRSGTQSEYDAAQATVGGISEEDLYYVVRDVDTGNQTVSIPNIYIGNDLIGDSYNTQFVENLTKRVTNPIGLIPYGMTIGKLLSLSGGKLSKVVDMMLFSDQPPMIDECGIIAGFIPEIEVNAQWSDMATIETWISDYAQNDFNSTNYEKFFDLEGEILTSFLIDLDPNESVDQYGEDVGQYTGRMFVAIPRSDSVESKTIDTIVDKVFDQVYTGTGLTNKFIQYTGASLQFGEESYPYRIYLFGTTQNVMSRIDMEYSVKLD